MIQVKKKICAGCGHERRIWKRIGGKPYCQRCAYSIEPPKSLEPSTRKIPSRSDKRIIADKQYSKLRKKHLIENPCCVAHKHGLVLDECTRDNPHFLTIQHKRGKATIELYLDTRFWITLCLSCHQWVNVHPREAIDLGLAESRLKIDNGKNIHRSDDSAAA